MDQLLTEEQVAAITEAIKRLFPTGADVRLLLTTEARVRYFDVKMERTDLEELSGEIYGVAVKALQEMCFNESEIIGLLEEEGYSNGYADKRFYLDKLDLNQFFSGRPPINLERDLSETLEITYTLKEMAKKVIKEMEIDINRCLPEGAPMTLGEYRDNQDLTFILTKNHYSSQTVGNYRINNAADLTKMMKNLCEMGELVRQAKEPKYRSIAQKFMKALKRTDWEDFDTLVTIFTDTFCECLVGERAFIEEYLTNIVTQYGFAVHQGWYIVDLG